MKFTAIRLAREDLRSHRSRSRLSTIGIVISVFMVSIVFIISDSVKANIEHQATSLSKNTVIVNGAVNNGLFNLADTPDDTLINLDASRIKQATGHMATVNSSLLLHGNITTNNNQLANATTIATTISDPNLLDLELLDGDWFNGSSHKKWVVLGEDAANQLLGTTKVQSQVISIKGEEFTVVGIIKKTHRPLSVLGYNVDKSAFISLDNGQALGDDKKLSQIIISGVNDAAETKRVVAQVLTNNHSDSGDYVIDTGANIVNKLHHLVNYLTIAACAIASIILLVSSIGVANILLVNVVERQREIGIRKAVGATTTNIMNQFLAESLIMSLQGGVVGLLLAYGVAAVALLFFAITVTFSWWALAIGFAVPIVVGVVAGVYPAVRAARQDIIAALNQLT